MRGRGGQDECDESLAEGKLATMFERNELDLKLLTCCSK